ncbi:MAG TPA: NAD(P)-binding domain-containing protein [Actinomycetota bacterium]|nr:NAD(P)-binding domain-containing protein [Actinomycetota bacterium]
MAELRPFPPGDYPCIVVGSGPGGLQTSYSLSRLGVRHAVLSADDAPGGMFRRYPLFQRLISWTKPYAPAEPGTRAYEWYDWNSLLGAEPEHSSLVRQFMDGSSYFPARSEMEAGLVEFSRRGGVEVRYGCRWESTDASDNGFTVGTSDGEYTCRVLVMAIGTTTPWKPATPGLEQVPHYCDTKPLAEYRDKTVFIVGKRNSGFELADALLPVARRIILGSPRPARISVVEHAAVGARARYLQPYEDAVFGGGNVLLDAAISRVERISSGYRITAAGTTRPGEMVLEVDEAIAATGFKTPLLDLPKLGVAVFSEGRLPAMSSLWGSVSVPGLYFAGSVTQAAPGLNKYGIPSNSAAVQGYRYNARVMAEHIATSHFGIPRRERPVAPDSLVSHLLAEATRAPELWNQRSYLASVVETTDRGLVDAGIQPLAWFVDAPGPDAIAVAVETDASGDIHPALYLRLGGAVTEHLLESEPLHRFETPDHRRRVEEVAGPLIGQS